MIILGIVFIVCLAAFFLDVQASPRGMVFAGSVSFVAFWVMCGVGLALAVHAL